MGGHGIAIGPRLAHEGAAGLIGALGSNLADEDGVRQPVADMIERVAPAEPAEAAACRRRIQRPAGSRRAVFIILIRAAHIAPAGSIAIRIELIVGATAGDALWPHRTRITTRRVDGLV